MWKNIRVEDTRIKSALNQVLDRAAVLDRMGGNTELIKGVVKIFNEDSPAQLFQIGKAIESGDEKSLLALAHTLKGSVANFGAKGAYEIALKLETMGRTGDLSQASAMLAELEAAVSRLESELTALKDHISEP